MKLTSQQFKNWAISIVLVIVWYSFNLAYANLLPENPNFKLVILFILTGGVAFFVGINKEIQKIGIKTSTQITRLMTLIILWFIVLYELYFTIKYLNIRKEYLFMASPASTWIEMMSFGGLFLMIIITFVNYKLFLKK